jgi:hypothetical protein
LNFEALKIVGLCTLGAILFGIAHDMVTAHVCVEYFSVGHKNIFGAHHTGPPVVYALYWGVVATWWIGFPAGILIALVSRLSGLPRLTWRQVARPMAIGLAMLWACSMIVLFVNLPLGRRGLGGLFAPRPSLGEVESQFLTVAATHSFSYAAAPLAVLIVAAVLLRTRMRLHSAAADQDVDSKRPFDDPIRGRKG